MVFLSTPSARRATQLLRSDACKPGNFYPRPPRGGRPLSFPGISIYHSYFYPRPPRGGRLFCCPLPAADNGISIHALREEGDSAPTAGVLARRNFYPRPPRGGRLVRVFVLCDTNIFLSTPSARRATDLNDERAKLTKISIHALREEGDAPAYCEQTSFCYFYPRPPRGGRLAVKCINHFVICISIHALREEGDGLQSLQVGRLRHFYPRPPRGGRLCGENTTEAWEQFLSTPSARRATR